ncbi:MAG: hypothetical protein A2283_08440 [Lentisphaerae bacterium RIFOXYA12_FULL_48_11]|nr:MAG: hypothetical protein A2283_08440 [Lentisphaerae bacterium RIFOXYA12_FULL_48_11]
MIPHSRPDISGKEIRAVVTALGKRHLSQGSEVQKLEAKLSRMYNGAEAVVVSSGTAALYLSLLALGIKAGHKVIIPSYTCNSLYAAVNLSGATAICADSGENSVNIDVSTIDPLIDEKTAALIVPHMFGFLANIGSIKKTGIPLIEDCAQAIGGHYPDGTLTGTKGDIAILSFYATKLVPAGEGGACITKHSKTAEIIRSLRDCDKQRPRAKAFNFKMTDISATLAVAKLSSLQANIRQRSSIAEKFDQALGNNSFRLKSSNPQCVCFRYLASRQKNLQSILQKSLKAGISCNKPTWQALHHSIGGHCPNAEMLERTLLSVPLYPGLTRREIRRICRVLPELLAE